jgi:hypothetical protein
VTLCFWVFRFVNKKQNLDELQINLESNQHRNEGQKQKQKEHLFLRKDSPGSVEMNETPSGENGIMSYEQFKQNALEKLNQKMNNKGKKQIK